MGSAGFPSEDSGFGVALAFFRIIRRNQYLRSLLNSFMFRSEIYRNVAKMLSGNAIAQMVGLLFYPLLTRLYRPEDFGLLNLFLSIGGVLVLVANADYHYAILLPKNEKKAVGAWQVSTLCALAVVVLCGISVFFKGAIAGLFNTPELAVVYPLLPLFVALSAAWMLLNYWFTRQKKFGAISTYQVSQNLSNALLKWGFGAAGRLQWGLFVSTILGLAVSLGLSVAGTFRAWGSKLLHFDWGSVRMAARRYVRFPAFSLPRSLVNNLSGNLPFFMLTPFFGVAEMGFLGMGFTLAFRPVNMISSSLYQVFFQRFAENVQNRRRVMPFFRKFVLGCFLVVIPSFALLYWILPDLCAWLLGEEWLETGRYIRLMLPWIAMVCAGSCVSFLSDLFQKQALMLWVEVAYLGLRAAGLAVGIALRDIRMAILLYSLGGVLVIGFQLLCYRKWIKDYEVGLEDAEAATRGNKVKI